MAHIGQEHQHDLSKTCCLGLPHPIPTPTHSVFSSFSLHPLYPRLDVQQQLLSFISSRQVFIDDALFAHQTDLPFQTLTVLGLAARLPVKYVFAHVGVVSSAQ